MVKIRTTEDQIQLGILIVAVLTLVGAALDWGLDHFATAQDLQQIKARVDKFDDLPTDVAVIKEEVHEINKKMDRLNR